MNTADSLVIDDYDTLTNIAELTRRIDSLTYHQIRDLHVVRDVQKITLRGCSTSYYVKQLASQAVINLLPRAVIENGIYVSR